MIYFLINPVSQKRKGKRIWKNIEHILKQENISHQVFLSRSKEDIIAIARNLTSDDVERTIVIMGGDGTLNAFLNGITSSEHIKIGYLPVGSGNDFARGMNITSNYKEEIDLILHDKQIRKVHYGVVRYKSGREKRFFVSSGIGYDARVCYHSDHSKIKKILNLFGLGRLIYLTTGLRYLLNARTFPASLSIDSEEMLEGNEFLFTSFHVLPYEGGGFKFCPNVRPESNLLHICAVEGISKKKIPFIIPQAFLGTHIYRNGVNMFTCKKAEIVTSQPQYVHTDGETDFKYDRIEVRISNDLITFLN